MTARTVVIGAGFSGLSAAFALLVHLMLWLPVTLVGGLLLLVAPRAARRAPAARPATARPSHPSWRPSGPAEEIA